METVMTVQARKDPQSSRKWGAAGRRTDSAGHGGCTCNSYRESSL